MEHITAASSFVYMQSCETKMTSSTDKSIYSNYKAYKRKSRLGAL